MPVQKLKDFLASQKVKYVTIQHSTAYTAREVAASAHIPAREMAKTLILNLDEVMAMAVIPATEELDLERIRALAGVKTAELATEKEFESRFPDCETGAMPPFGHLYGMVTYASETMAEEHDIAFNAGNHHEVILMNYGDFDRLVGPITGRISHPIHALPQYA